MDEYNDTAPCILPQSAEHKLNELRRIAVQQDRIPPRILQGLRDGDHECYRIVFTHWYKPIHHFVRKLTDTAEEADDITQDIFTLVWEYRENIDPERNIRSFLFLAARRKISKMRRNNSVRSRYRDSGMFEDIDNFTSYDIIVEREAELLKTAALSRMPASQRQIFLMSHEEGLPTDEIARRLGVKKETVYNQLHRARKEIRELLLAFIVLFVSPASQDKVFELIESLVTMQ